MIEKQIKYYTSGELDPFSDGKHFYKRPGPSKVNTKLIGSLDH